MIMERYTIPQRVQIIKFFYQNGCSIRQTYRALREIYGRVSRPTERTIRRLITKFENTGSVSDQTVPVRRRTARSIENIEAVRQSVRNNPSQSISRRAQELDFSWGTTWRILHMDLKLHPYKVVLTQELKPNDHRLRRFFAEWALEQLEVDPDFGRKIIFSDEAHFWMNGYVNKQNCRIWSEENPREIYERPLHPTKVTVWCAFWVGGIIGPYFFQNEQGDAVTVNGERYRTMITDYFYRRLDGMDIRNFWFQQDGATCHTARETITLLRERFHGCLISRGGDVSWPPRSCDLTPLDFFLWGYLKARVYANKPRTPNDLKNNIRMTINEIQPALCETVIENWISRIRATQRSRGGHLPDILFHT